MANVEYIKPIKELHGKLNKADNTYFRRMHGKSVAIKMNHPRTEKVRSDGKRYVKKHNISGKNDR